MSCSYYSSFQYWCAFPSETSIFNWGGILTSWSCHNILLRLHIYHLQPKCYADGVTVSVMTVLDWQSWLQPMFWRRSTPMPLCCFLSFVRPSPRWQASVSTLLSPTYGVNTVSGVIDLWLVLPTCRCPCPSPTCHFFRRPFFQTSLKRRWGRMPALLPVNHSPYGRTFVIHSSVDCCFQ